MHAARGTSAAGRAAARELAVNAAYRDRLVTAGDVIVAVDGQPAAATSLAAARARFKGTAGRKVRLTIDRGAQRVVTLRDLV